jgi:hypothetical protein
MKPRLVLTGKMMDEFRLFAPGIHFFGGVLHGTGRMEDFYVLRIGTRLYEYRVQYQTPERKELS